MTAYLIVITLYIAVIATVAACRAHPAPAAERPVVVGLPAVAGLSEPDTRVTDDLKAILKGQESDRELTKEIAEAVRDKQQQFSDRLVAELEGMHKTLQEISILHPHDQKIAAAANAAAAKLATHKGKGAKS